MINARLLLILYLLLGTQICKAQYSFEGLVCNDKKQALNGAQIIISRNDSLIGMALTNEKGKYAIRDIRSGEYKLNIICAGYTAIDEKLFILDKDVKSSFTLLPEMQGILKEVEVTANRNDKVERTATGQIFYLSEKAKNCGDPYRALREIPRLISNEANQSIKMDDGISPLILIDGNRINSGITPIDPKEIESIEIIDEVSARYLKDGVKHIVNIRLKKKTNPYSFFQAMTRHNFPVRRGTGAVYFEIGNPKYSLYGRFAGEYIYNDDSDTRSQQKNTGYFKSQEGNAQQNKGREFGELQFRWMATDKDYTVAHIYGSSTLLKENTNGDGFLQTDTKNNFDYCSSSRDDSYILTGSLFHKHTFAPENMLETTLAYNKNHNKTSGSRKENYSDWLYTDGYQYKNDRSSLRLDIDYSYTWNKVNSLNIGNEIHFTNDRIHQISENYPVFRHKEWNEYIYASFSSKYGNFLYMLSAGMEGLWLTAAEKSHHYFKPRLSFSGTYKLTNNHSIHAGYSLTNTAPNISMLNPYNTSTDSFLVIKGNPYLKPAQTHNIRLSYTFNKKKFYLTPKAAYRISTDLIEDYGFSDKGVYTSTYCNKGVFRNLSIGTSMSYRLKEGNIYASAYRYYNYFSGQKAKKVFNINGGFMTSFGKWTLFADVSYIDYDYTAFSRTKQYVPDYSLLQVTYNFTKNFYISAAVEQCTGVVRSATTTENADYHSYQFQRYKDRSFRPWILVRYTIRKNNNQRIKENKLLNSQEEGIKL